MHSARAYDPVPKTCDASLLFWNGPQGCVTKSLLRAYMLLSAPANGPKKAYLAFCKQEPALPSCVSKWQLSAFAGIADLEAYVNGICTFSGRIEVLVPFFHAWAKLDCVGLHKTV